MARITGAQVLAEMLQGYGVSHVFMVPAVLRRTFAEMEHRTKIKRIHTHGEKAAAYMTTKSSFDRSMPVASAFRARMSPLFPVSNRMRLPAYSMKAE